MGTPLVFVVGVWMQSPDCMQRQFGQPCGVFVAVPLALHKGKARVEEAGEDTGRGPNCGPALTRGGDHMASSQAGSLAVLLCFFKGSVFSFWFAQGLTASSSSPVLGAQPAWPIRMQSILHRTTQSNACNAMY